MKKNLLIGGAILAVLAVLTVAYVLRPPEEASAPVEAVPLDLETETVNQPTVEAAVPTETAGAQVGSDPSAGSGEALTGVVLFTISQEESEVRFSIDEILNDAPVTAVGISNQVAGEIAIDFDNPAASQIGVITINARTLETDRSNRNRMIQNEILDTAEFEFITFTPTDVTGLPATITPGETVSFQVTGDLQIRHVTQSTTFDVTATVGSDGRLVGYAVATVLRSEFEITIPSVPSVAEVSDEVLLEIDFVAVSE